MLVFGLANTKSFTGLFQSKSAQDKDEIKIGGRRMPRPERNTHSESELYHALKDGPFKSGDLQEIKEIIEKSPPEAISDIIRAIYESKMPYWEKPDLIGTALLRFSEYRMDGLSGLINSFPRDSIMEEAVPKVYRFVGDRESLDISRSIDSLLWPEWRLKARSGFLDGLKNRINEDGGLLISSLSKFNKEMNLTPKEIESLLSKLESVPSGNQMLEELDKISNKENAFSIQVGLIKNLDKEITPPLLREIFSSGTKDDFITKSDHASFLFESYDRQDPEGFKNWIFQKNGSPRSQEETKIIFKRWCDSGKEQPKEWLKRQPDSRLVDILMNDIEAKN